MLRSPLLPIFLTVFVDVLGLTLMLPLLPFYAEHFGADADCDVTRSRRATPPASSSPGPILGRLSDRVGRKPVLLVSQIGHLRRAFLAIGSAAAALERGLRRSGLLFARPR